MGRYVLKIETYSETATAVPDTDKIDKRKHSRVPICVPISCVSIDTEGMPLDQNIGLIKDVSQAGVGIEAHNDVRSDRLILTFVDLDMAMNTSVPGSKKKFVSKKSPFLL